jgi:hypothetical protein
VASAAPDSGLLDRIIDDVENYRLLRYIDRYGDTYFNKLQMPDFLSDWGDAETWAHTPADQAFFVEIERLAVACRDGVHLYLRFVGD